MQRLYTIIRLFKEYILLGALVVFSLVLLNANNNRQVRAIRSFTVGFVGAIQQILSIVPNVFELQHENQVLRQLNVNLSDDVNRLREARLENLRLRTMLGLKERSPFRVAAADVIAKNVNLLRNTVTLNIGEAEGLHSDMPIISEAGLVGKVIATSAHYSVGQLMFNKEFRASAKIQRSGVDGIIAWDGGYVLQLKNIAKNQDVHLGDVVVTSEYSNLFPRNIKVGLVSNITERPGSLLKEVEVTPTVDFATLEQVFVVFISPDPERAAVEQQALGR
jgi:rod shape-determining protein MreC